MTQYSLNVRKVRNEQEFDILVNELTRREIIRYALDNGFYYPHMKEASFGSYDPVRWNNHVQDMVMISEQFPAMYFELEGAGEPIGDFWKEYYHDGEVEYCRGEIVYEQPKKVQWTELVAF